MNKRKEPSSPLWFAALVAAILRPGETQANPAGLTVASGSATMHAAGGQLNINVSPTAVLNWQSFNIAAGEKTAFLQPAPNSVVVNVIGGANPSQIFGSLTANGTVILENANGFYFGPNSFVSVGGSFLATTAPAPEHLESGGWQFTGMPPLAAIVNYGQIHVGQGKSLYLIAENIANAGELDAPGGSVELAAGQTVLVSERPDGRGLSAAVTLPAGAVDNFGRITADGGSIAAQAQVINQNGILQADSIQNVNGEIELVAASQLRLGANSELLARGDGSAGGSPGGQVILKSGGSFRDATGSQIITTGGTGGGDGGNVEVSAPAIESLDSAMDARAGSGWSGGQLLVDPVNITLTASGATTTGALPNPGGTVNGSASGSANWNLDVNTAFLNKNFTRITLEASGTITLNTGLNWNLFNSTGVTAGTLTLEAGQNIVFGKNSSITDAKGWNVTLLAGVNNYQTGSINSGTGNIYLNGSGNNNYNGSIQTSAGNITLEAGNSIQTGTGSVSTTGGGSIFAWAESGSLYTGLLKPATSSYNFYNFSGSGESTPAVLGGFSTAAGGNVTLIAGATVSPAASLNTPLPTGQNKWPIESGAFGGGDVTVIAGGAIGGNYLTTAGTGTLLAGAPVGSLSAAQVQSLQSHNSGFSGVVTALTASLQANPVAGADIGTAAYPILLSESSGTWNAASANDIFLNEVNNPQGAFNIALGFQFNYAANAAANIWAYDAITLEGGGGTLGLPRTSGNSSMLPIGAPQLSLNAGAGGITLENSLVLFPSPTGSLAITTRNGGSLKGQNGAAITVSDSGSTAFGNANDFTLTAATAATPPLASANPNAPAQINVTGNWENLGLNLPEAAQINVLGNVGNTTLQIWNLHTADTTTINVGAAAEPALSARGLYAPSNPNLTVGGDVNLFGTQWQLLGPGTFNLNAATLELDDSASITAGESIQPVGDALYGSQFNITTTGDIKLTTTAALVNSGLNGGLTVSAGWNGGGQLNIGNPAYDALTQNQPTAGIFTSSGGDVLVKAGGNISVGLSRIATYDGGNITVLSQNGSVNCGDGSLGVTYVNNAYERDATSGQLVDLLAGLGANEGAGFGFGIPGSGIRANTFVDGNAILGNILIEAPNGSVNAQAGGIVALHFNSLAVSHAADAVLDVYAGFELLDNQGYPLTAAQLTSGNTLKTLTPGAADPYVSADLLDASGLTLGQFLRVSENEDITSSDSGIIGQIINAQATGQITGLFAGRQVSVTAPQLGQVVVFSHDPPVISGNSLSGNDPVIVSPTVDTAAAPSAAPAVEAPVADTAGTATAKTQGNGGDTLDDVTGKKKGKGISLAQKVSRVTVVLPANSQP